MRGTFFEKRFPSNSLPKSFIALLGVRGWLTDEDADKSRSHIRIVEGDAHISLLQGGEGVSGADG